MPSDSSEIYLHLWAGYVRAISLDTDNEGRKFPVQFVPTRTMKVGHSRYNLSRHGPVIFCAV